MEISNCYINTIHLDLTLKINKKGCTSFDLLVNECYIVISVVGVIKATQITTFIKGIMDKVTETKNSINIHRYCLFFKIVYICNAFYNLHKKGAHIYMSLHMK